MTVFARRAVPESDQPGAAKAAASGGEAVCRWWLTPCRSGGIVPSLGVELALLVRLTHCGQIHLWFYHRFPVCKAGAPGRSQLLR
ncbi:hypothetical protein [[Phormidium] sp. ETS-05]|uniref:hypothetical protein n=1 Tax=[Phormidium] sp. ETS-05 TaxID=222819 RepID=UPI0018EF2BDD|nr:hypothetical protein [[Phormidium] sp. ETS-05]